MLCSSDSAPCPGWNRTERQIACLLGFTLPRLFASGQGVKANTTRGALPGQPRRGHAVLPQYLTPNERYTLIVVPSHEQGQHSHGVVGIVANACYWNPFLTNGAKALH